MGQQVIERSATSTGDTIAVYALVGGRVDVAGLVTDRRVRGPRAG